MEVKAKDTQNYNKYFEEYRKMDIDIIHKKKLINNLLNSNEFKTLKINLDKYKKEVFNGMVW